MGDLISRQEALNHWVILYEDIDTMVDAVPVDVIKELPSVEPERKKGHWIPVTNGRGGHECNLCHSYAPAYQTGEEYLTDYCPSCGADMRGEQDES